MTGILNLLAGAVSSVIKDTYFNLTTLLLPGDGTNGAQNNTFLDSSTNNFTITRNGNTTQGTFSPFSQTGWSNYLTQASNSLSVASSSSLASGTSSFTLEFWYNSGATGNGRPMGNGSGAAYGANNWVFGSNNTAGKLELFVYNYNTSTAMFSSTSSTIASDNQWHHIAIVRSGNTWAMFIDGTRQGSSVTSSVSFNGTSSGITIGGSGISGETATAFVGYLSNVRFVNGSAVYDPTQTTITVPTTPLTAITNTSLLTCQSNRFIDNSSNAFTITVTGTPSVQAFSPFAPTAAYSAATVGGSGYFDGSGDYLSLGTTSALNFGTNNFTVEAVVYQTQNNTVACILASGNGTWGAGAAIFNIGNGTPAFGLYDQNSVGSVATGPALTNNAWNHVAVTRNGNTITIYTNGSAGTPASLTAGRTVNFNTNNASKIGGGTWDGSTSYLYGYMSCLRVSDNVRTITYPTSPYTNDGNTVLLTNFTNAGITDATAKNVLETVGNAQISTTQSKFGGSSMYFDGTGDLLALPNNELFNLSSGDFTIEGWFYANSTTSNGALVSKMNYNGTNWTGFAVFQFNQTIVFYHANAGSINNITTGNVITSTGTWYHIAVVKSGTATNNTKIYIDGVQQAQGTPSIGNASKPLTVGGTNSTYGWDTARELNCYIDDLRITRYARYTSAFTPPTAPFALQ